MSHTIDHTRPPGVEPYDSEPERIDPAQINAAYAALAAIVAVLDGLGLPLVPDDGDPVALVERARAAAPSIRRAARAIDALDEAEAAR